MSSLAERLRLAFDRRPEASQAELARYCGVKQPSVNDWLSGKTKSMKAEPLRRAAIYFGCDPYWLSTGHGQPNWLYAQHSSAGRGTPLLAQEMSQLEQIVLPRQLEWGTIMSGSLPDQFTLSSQDAAMQPKYSQSTRFIFDTKRSPQAGDVVLIRDSDGDHYIREYRLLRQGHWTAHAHNPAYAPMEASVRGLSIVAVAIGALWS